MCIFEPDWPALYSAGPARIPPEHDAYAHLSRPFLDFFVGGSEYETNAQCACLSQCSELLYLPNILQKIDL